MLGQGAQQPDADLPARAEQGSTQDTSATISPAVPGERRLYCCTPERRPGSSQRPSTLRRSLLQQCLQRASSPRAPAHAPEEEAPWCHYRMGKDVGSPRDINGPEDKLWAGAERGSPEARKGRPPEAPETIVREVVLAHPKGSCSDARGSRDMSALMHGQRKAPYALKAEQASLYP